MADDPRSGTDALAQLLVLAERQRILAQAPEPETCWHCRQPVQDTTAGAVCSHCGAALVPF